MTLSNIYQILILYTIIFTIQCVELHEVKVFKRGKIQIVDETQFNEGKNAVEYDDYDTNPKRQPSFGDIYDELIAYLPRFEAFKNGKNIGFTRIPIVTRRQPTWSTPLPRTRKGDYKTWSTPRLEPVTKPSQTSATLRATKEKASSHDLTESISTFTTTPPLSTTVKMKTANRINPHRTVVSKPQSATLRDPKRLVTPAPKVIDGEKPNKKEAQSRNHQVGRNREKNNRNISTTTTTTTITTTTSTPSAKIITTRVIPRRFMHNRDQTVKSNHFTVEAFSNTTKKTTVVSKTQRQQQEHIGSVKFSTKPSPSSRRTTLFSWSRSWSLSPKGVLTIHDWDSRQGTKTKILFSTTAIPTKRKHFNNATAIVLQKNTKPKTSNPMHFFVGKSTNREAPKHNCPVLNAATDGRPSPLNDEDCRLSSPGFSADGSCKCAYEAGGRDSKGCVIGFIYTCIPIQGATKNNR